MSPRLYKLPICIHTPEKNKISCIKKKNKKSSLISRLANSCHPSMHTAQRAMQTNGILSNSSQESKYRFKTYMFIIPHLILYLFRKHQKLWTWNWAICIQLLRFPNVSVRSQQKTSSKIRRGKKDTKGQTPFEVIKMWVYQGHRSLQLHPTQKDVSGLKRWFSHQREAKLRRKTYGHNNHQLTNLHRRKDLS